MGKYSIYARQLDEAFKEARRKYKEAFNLMESKREEMERIQGNPNLADTFGEKAEYDYRLAKSAFEKLDVWEKFDRQRAEIRAALEGTLRKANQARPEDLDGPALELLRSGILTISEIGAFLDKYENNPTMRRLAVQHIEKLLEETTDIEDRRALLMLRQKAGASDIMEKWENLEYAARVASGASGDGTKRKDPVFMAAISQKWEQMASSAVENF